MPPCGQSGLHGNEPQVPNFGYDITRGINNAMTHVPGLTAKTRRDLFQNEQL